jgi:hypothetical protein
MHLLGPRSLVIGLRSSRAPGDVARLLLSGWPAIVGLARVFPGQVTFSTILGGRGAGKGCQLSVDGARGGGFVRRPCSRWQWRAVFGGFVARQCHLVVGGGLFSHGIATSTPGVGRFCTGLPPRRVSGVGSSSRWRFCASSLLEVAAACGFWGFCRTPVPLRRRGRAVFARDCHLDAGGGSFLHGIATSGRFGCWFFLRWRFCASSLLEVAVACGFWGFYRTSVPLRRWGWAVFARDCHLGAFRVLVLPEVAVLCVVPARGGSGVRFLGVLSHVSATSSLGVGRFRTGLPPRRRPG